MVTPVSYNPMYDQFFPKDPNFKPNLKGFNSSDAEVKISLLQT